MAYIDAANINPALRQETQYRASEAAELDAAFCAEALHDRCGQSLVKVYFGRPNPSAIVIAMFGDQPFHEKEVIVRLRVEDRNRVAPVGIFSGVDTRQVGQVRLVDPNKAI